MATKIDLSVVHSFVTQIEVCAKNAKIQSAAHFMSELGGRSLNYL